MKAILPYETLDCTRPTTHRHIPDDLHTQQHGYENLCANANDKLLKTNAAIWFNQVCRIEHLDPKYISVTWLITIGGGGGKTDHGC
jgi:hypothetical protein